MYKHISAASAALLALGFAAAAHAIPVTVNMTADNVISSGGLCDTATCQNGTAWASLGTVPNAGDWRQADSVVLDLGAGTHSFAWQVTNTGSPSTGNPAGLLAEILWQGNASYSSSAWEVYDVLSGNFIALATGYGANGGANVWTGANGGSPIAGISTSATWIYTANNFAEADASAWIRTTITIRAVPEPGVLPLLGAALLTLGLLARRRRR